MSLQRFLAGCALAIGMTAFSPVAMAGEYSGVYVGPFFGNAGNGGIVMMVNDNDVAVLLAYDFTNDDGLNKTSIAIDSDGSFFVSNVDGRGTSVGGTVVAGESVSGTFVSLFGTATFSGTAMPNDGMFSSNGGYYTGTARTVPAQCFGIALIISIHVVITADGLLFLYTRDPNGVEDAGTATISAVGVFRGTTLKGNAFAGTVSDGGTGTTFSGSGTEFDVEGNCRYTSTGRRVQALPTMFGDADDRQPAHDFTGDSKSDVLVRSTSTGQWFLYPMDGRQVVNGADRGPVKLTGNLSWQTVGVADFTGDKKADVLIRDTTTGQWFLYPMDGRLAVGGAHRGPVKLTGHLSWRTAGVADFTGDGKADVLIRDERTGQWFLYPMDGRSVLGGADRGPVRLTGNLRWHPVGVADFTGDGRADVLMRDETTGQWFLYPMDGRLVVSGAHRGPVKLTGNLSWQTAGVADFTGDGKADVLVRDTTTGQWFLYPMDGRFVVNGPHRGPVKLTSGLEWLVEQVEDFTEDGKADLLIRSTSTGQWFLYAMDGRFVSGADSGGVRMTGNTAWETQ